MSSARITPPFLSLVPLPDARRTRLVALAALLSPVLVACASPPSGGTDAAGDTAVAPPDAVDAVATNDAQGPDAATLDVTPDATLVDNIADSVTPEDSSADGPSDAAKDAADAPSAVDAAPDALDAAPDAVAPVDATPDATTGDTADASVDTAPDAVAPPDGAADSSVMNRAPVVTSCTIRRADLAAHPGRTNDALEVLATATDADGDAVRFTYAWTVGSNPAGSGATLAATAFARGDVVGVTCVALDVHNAMSAPLAAATTTIANSPPSLVAVTIQPPRPTASDALVALPSGYADADGDRGTYSFRWVVNGVDVTDARGGNLAVLPAGVALRGASVSVRVVPSDGMSAGATVTSPALTLVDAPPVLNGPMHTYAAGTTLAWADENTDLNCIPTSGATDADADTITYDVEWWRFRPADPFGAPDGAGSLTRVQFNANVPSTTGSAWNFSAAGTAYADRFFCRVTPVSGVAGARGQTLDASALLVYDTSAPAPPSLDPVDRYRNDAVVHLRGACDASCTFMQYDCTSSTGTHVASPAPVRQCSANRYDFTVSLPVSTWTCTTWCSDGAATASLHAWSQTTERCSTGESYETPGDGAGDTLAAAINSDLSVWAPLADAPPSTVTFSGNILGPGLDATDRVDWYRFRAIDLDQGATDAFDFEVALTAGASDYEVLVVREDGTTVPMEPHPLVPGGDTYSWTPASALVTCPTGAPGVDSCVDYSASFWLRVTRPSGAGCGGYAVRVQNGR